MDNTATERFEAGRDRLASLAYRLLGSAADAEDAVQDAFVRWQAADRERIEVPEAWLTKIVTNLCLDRLRSARARRERVVGTWLPEPLLEGDPMLGPADTFEQRESVSLAVLLLLERLSPVERAVYVLREAFSFGHAEIAEVLDISESASQQHAHRARRRVTAARRGGEVDRESAQRIVEEFLTAATSGRVDRLVALLTDDATAMSDGAGFSETVIEFRTAQRIAALARAGFTPSAAKRRLVGGSLAFHFGLVNGSPAMLAVLAGNVRGMVAFEISEGRVTTLRGIGAASRLGRLSEAWRGRDHGEPIIADW
ncbi:RNA polymerase sigma factor SigJ [Salininema proteolyticum]|uniref:RNA polymerase sigma factor SigJ n=1 Tax=Salininema proteolyticum TaxID=1607685 RepID=A0ABV8U3Z9_9ACTN